MEAINKSWETPTISELSIRFTRSGAAPYTSETEAIEKVWFDATQYPTMEQIMDPVDGPIRHYDNDIVSTS